MALQIYNRKKAAVAEAVRRLTAPPPGDTDPRLLLTVVLFGDGNFSATYKGSVSSHYRQVREALRGCPTAAVINIHEAGTSKARARGTRAGHWRPRPFRH